MKQSRYELNPTSRAVVLAALREVCVHRGGSLFAAHVRRNHVPVVVEGEAAPERLMNVFKAYASRALNRHHRSEQGRWPWARHGSTRWLWSDQDVRQAIRYVIERQGEPMAVFLGDIP